MNSHIRPIETHYKGRRFRSRLEARWAVFFDALGIKWDYEPEGFEIPFDGGQTIRYLPDFYLPDLNLWVEVKGSKAQFAQDSSRIAWMVDFGHLPGVSDGGGLVILGPMPEVPRTRYVVAHPVFHHSEGVGVSLVSFDKGHTQWWPWSDEVSSAPDLPSPFDPNGFYPGYPDAMVFWCPGGSPGMSPAHAAAYRAALSARFEFGEAR